MYCALLVNKIEIVEYNDSLLKDTTINFSLGTDKTARNKISGFYLQNLKSQQPSCLIFSYQHFSADYNKNSKWIACPFPLCCE